MMKRARVILWISLALATSSQAAQQGVPWADRLAHVRSYIQVEPQGITGPGSLVLEHAIHDARYVLIGEDHLSREIPAFTSAVCSIMAPDGLRAMAVEIGPEAAGVVNAALRRPDRLDQIDTFMHGHPDAMAFQNGRDENDMAAACAKAAGADFAVWGLDQEFFGAAGYLLEQMAVARPGPVALAAIDHLLAADRTATASALSSGSPTKLLIFTLTDQELADAQSAICRDGGARASELFAALRDTRAIYLSQNSDSFASNGARARLMKRTLIGYLNKAPANARVLFKYGDTHMAKGINALGQRDLGNFVAERADGEGSHSLHLLVLGRHGIHALYNGVGRQVRHEPFILTDDADYAWLKDALPPDDIRSVDWMLLDLRALRTQGRRDIPAEWRRIVYGFDIIVIAPKLTPSSLAGTQ